MFTSMAHIRRRAAHAGSHFFTRETMRYWGSEVENHDTVYPVKHGGVFITSEVDMQAEDRRYSVRVATESAGKPFTVDTVGEFRGYATLAEARSAAEAYAAENAPGN